MTDTVATGVALSVAGVIAPYLVEVIKNFLPERFTTRGYVTTVVIIVSLFISTGVLWFQGELSFANSNEVFAGVIYTAGVMQIVYNYLKPRVQSQTEQAVNRFR